MNSNLILLRLFEVRISMFGVSLLRVVYLVSSPSQSRAVGGDLHSRGSVRRNDARKARQNTRPFRDDSLGAIRSDRSGDFL